MTFEKMEYTNAHIGTRALAFLINNACIIFLWQLLTWIEVEDRISQGIVAIGAVYLSTYLYQSPGKRLMGLKVLMEDDSALSYWQRLIRNLPIIGLCGLFGLSEFEIGDSKEILHNPIAYVQALIFSVCYLFIVCNFLTGLFNKKGQTLIDMGLGSSVKATNSQMKLKPLKNY